MDDACDGGMYAFDDRGPSYYGTFEDEYGCAWIQYAE